MANPIAYVRDDFTDGAIAPLWGASSQVGSATYAETSGQVRFTLPSSVAGSHSAEFRTIGTYDLTGDGLYINIETMVATGVAATAHFRLILDAANYLQWYQLSNTLHAATVIAGVVTDRYTATWSASTYKYLRIRESGGSVFWDSSTNGTSWTQRATLANPFAVTVLEVAIGASCGNIAAPGSFRLDDVNLILPALSSTWHWTQVEWPLLYRFKTITIASTSGQGYIATSNDGTTWAYYSGPIGSASGGYNQLTLQSTQAAAQAMAVNMPLDNRWDLPAIVECRFIRLYHRSITGSTYTLREYYPRRLVQADDIEAESIQTINLAANSVVADKIFVLELSAITANIGQLTLTSGTGAAAWLYQGTGTGDAPTTGLKIFNSGGIGKLSTYNATVEQVTLDTDGKLKAGAGTVLLDASGVAVVAASGGSAANPNSYQFLLGSTVIGRAAGYYDASLNSYVGMHSISPSGRNAVLEMFATGPSAKNGAILLTATGNNLASEVDFSLSALDDAITGIAAHTTFTGGLNIGSATGAITGEIRASDKLRLNSVTAMSQQMKSHSIVNNGQAQLCNSASELGHVLIADSSGGLAIFGLQGGVQATKEVSDPSGVFSVTAGTASSTNIYWSIGNARYEIENKRGSTLSYFVHIFV